MKTIVERLRLIARRMGEDKYTPHANETILVAVDAITALSEENARLRDLLDDQTAGEWKRVADILPPLHRQVLIRLRESAGGDVCDVATYVGEYQLPEGGKESRWLLADIRLDSRQITDWAFFRSPREIEADRAARTALQHEGGNREVL